MKIVEIPTHNPPQGYQSEAGKLIKITLTDDELLTPNLNGTVIRGEPGELISGSRIGGQKMKGLNLNGYYCGDPFHDGTK